MRVALCALVIAGTIAGCGSGGGQGRADTVYDSRPSGVFASKPPAAPSLIALSKAEIDRALLRLADMPAGFTVDRSRDSQDDSPSGCRKLDALDNFDVKAPIKGEVKYKGGAFGPFVDETVAVMGDSAEQLYRSFRDAMQSCHSFRSKNDDGSYSRGTFEALSFPNIGDDTFAAQMKIGPVPLVGSAYADFVLVRLGDVFVLLVTAQVAAPPDGSEFAQLSKKAVHRVKHA